MNGEIRNYVLQLLESYPERTRKIALLRYELEHPSQITSDEMISAMNYGHQSGIGRPVGHISNKTLYIALNYQDQAKRLNEETFEEISAQLTQLEREQAKLEYYLSLLGHRQELVIRRTCFERIAQEKVAEEFGVSVRRVQDIKAQAIDELTKMYQFTAKL